MQSKAYIDFLAVLLVKHRSKHLWVAFISSLLIAILASFLFVSSSIKRDTFISINMQPDFIVQKYRAGKVEDMPLSWKKQFEGIEGVESVSSRIHGLHFYEPLETHFTIVGINSFRAVSIFALYINTEILFLCISASNSFKSS